MGLKRIQCCIGIDPENKDYLESRGERVTTDFINWLVQKYREEESIRKAMGEPTNKPQGDDAILKGAIESSTDEKKEREIKIRAWFNDWENKGIVYAAIKVRRPTKADLCRIQKELFFSKYKLDVTTKEIAEVLRMEMSAFDIEKYVKEREERIERGGR